MQNRGIVSAYMDSKVNPVRFSKETCSIVCAGCGDTVPLSRATMRNQFRFSEEMQMARELHEDCGGLNPGHARTRRVWREAFIRENHTMRPDRLAYSV